MFIEVYLIVSRRTDKQGGKKKLVWVKKEVIISDLITNLAETNSITNTRCTNSLNWEYLHLEIR